MFAIVAPLLVAGLAHLTVAVATTGILVVVAAPLPVGMSGTIVTIVVTTGGMIVAEATTARELDMTTGTATET
ncbi:hypothetical protein FRB96_006328 [Tulasnella sp. 330]|nr:hypothetical protein FRB96_006328 [Tulasnella sp. 330]